MIAGVLSRMFPVTFKINSLNGGTGANTLVLKKNCPIEGTIQKIDGTARTVNGTFTAAHFNVSNDGGGKILSTSLDLGTANTPDSDTSFASGLADVAADADLTLTCNLTGGTSIREIEVTVWIQPE